VQARIRCSANNSLKDLGTTQGIVAAAVALFLAAFPAQGTDLARYINTSLETDVYAETVAKRQKSLSGANNLGPNDPSFEGQQDLFTDDAWSGMQKCEPYLYSSL
jgi:hypothetical protein